MQLNHYEIDGRHFGQNVLNWILWFAPKTCSNIRVVKLTKVNPKTTYHNRQPTILQRDTITETKIMMFCINMSTTWISKLYIHNSDADADDIAEILNTRARPISTMAVGWGFYATILFIFFLFAEATIKYNCHDLKLLQANVGAALRPVSPVVLFSRAWISSDKYLTDCCMDSNQILSTRYTKYLVPKSKTQTKKI